MTDCDIGILKLSGFVESEEESSGLIPTEFKVSGIHLSGVTYSERTNIFWFRPFETRQNVQVSVQDCHFSGLDFEGLGQIFLIESQLSSEILIEDTSFTRVKHGTIVIAASNTQESTLPTQVRMRNISIVECDSGENSFIKVLTNSILFFEDSTAERNWGEGQGTIIQAGQKKAKVFITNSRFFQNAGFEGGCVSSLYESKTVVTGSTFT